MTMERASDIVSQLSGYYAIDLFEHFVQYFDLMTEEEIMDFAQMCKFAVVVDAKLI